MENLEKSNNILVSKTCKTEFIIYIYIYQLNHIKTDITSSTAQGGGGSFKNRTPIGEVRGRESGMAERSHCWTDRRLISLSLFL